MNFWPQNVVKRGTCCRKICPSVHPSICPFVCPSHSLVTRTRFKVAKYTSRYTIERCLWFLATKLCKPDFRGLTLNECIKKRQPPCRQRLFEQYDCQSVTNEKKNINNYTRLYNEYPFTVFTALH